MAIGSTVNANAPVVVTLNGPLVVPRGVVTTTGPVVAAIGTVVVILWAVAVRTSALAPLNATAIGPGTKPSPAIVTSVPAVPLAGTIAVSAGASTTRKPRVAGAMASLPARSRAFTSKVCCASARPVTVTLVAEANALQAPPSRRQAKVSSAAVVSASVAANVNVAVVSATSPTGPLVIIVSGGVLSTTIVRVTTGDSFPAPSMAIADTVCAPSASSVVSQTPTAVSVVAGGTGSSVADSGRPAAFSLTLMTPLPSSRAIPDTFTIPCTCAPASGTAKPTVGGRSSCFSCAVAATEVSPSPPRPV